MTTHPGRWLAALGLGLVLSTTVDAQAQMLYRYVDDKGEVHMTDDANKLPKAGTGTVDSMPMPQATVRPAPGGLAGLQQECAQDAAINRILIARGEKPLVKSLRCEELEREQVRRLR